MLRTQLALRGQHLGAIRDQTEFEQFGDDEVLAARWRLHRGHDAFEGVLGRQRISTTGCEYRSIDTQLTNTISLTTLATMLREQLAQLLIVMQQPCVLREHIAALGGRLEDQAELLQFHDDRPTRSRPIDQLVVDPVDDICIANSARLQFRSYTVWVLVSVFKCSAQVK